MGLIAREIEAAGIPTLAMTSALSITRAANPPRAAFLDYPLGHTTGKPHDPELQRAILVDALRAFETLAEPGSVEMLPYRWSEDDADDADDSWKDRVMRPDPEAGGGHDDDRTERTAVPQYQTERDRELAEAALASGGCPTCVFLEGEDPAAA